MATASSCARLGTFFVIAGVGLSAVACKDADGTGKTKSGDAGAAPSGPAGKRAAAPADVCKLLSVTDVGAILGEKVEAKQAPGGGCQFAGGTRQSLYPLVTVTEDFAGAGGIDGSKSGAQATTGAVATPLTVGGASGYVVTGKLLGSTSTQGAVATRGLLVSVTLAGGEKASNEKVVTKLLELTLPKI
jgi:hypothetical protein